MKVLGPISEESAHAKVLRLVGYSSTTDYGNVAAVHGAEENGM